MFFTGKRFAGFPFGTVLLALAFSVAWPGISRAEQEAPQARKPESYPVRISGVIESGFLSVLRHEIRFSQDGTRFDYRSEGSQDVLFFNQRFSLEAEFPGGHTAVLLYQPLRLETQTSLRRTVRVDGLDFPAGETVDLLYDFPFYRVSYLYDFLAGKEAVLSVGFSLQIRNATIVFRSADGNLYRENRDVGPVPLLKLRGRLPLGSGFFAGLELDGAYAPISVLNGSDTEVVGALLDASALLGARRGRFEAFLNLRYLAGGAKGTSDKSGPGDGFVNNWLHFLVVTAGLRITLF
ncbi:MAG: hypothetical protein ACYTFG_01390 [Planctomycetota bacterium]|jgi:hypothetical protein